jgi:hypothetical protein
MPPEPYADTSETATIYQPLAVWRVGAQALILPLLLIMNLFLGIIMLSNYRRTGSITLGDAFFPIVLVGLGSIALWRAKRTPDTIFLKVSPSGIEYHSAQLVIQTTWENVESLIADPLAPAIGLSRPAATHMSRLLGRDLSTGRRIPLSAFAYSPHSALAQDLRRYAPHLYTTRA